MELSENFPRVRMFGSLWVVRLAISGVTRLATGMIMVGSNTAALKRRRRRSTWTPSPLLLSPRSMEVAITKERLRCDRHGHFFALIVFKLHHEPEIDSGKQERQVAKILHKRLRLTDEKGLLLQGGLGVLLPMTELHGAQIVLNSIIHSANSVGLQFDAEVFTYSGKDTSSSEQNTSSSSKSDSEIGFDEDESMHKALTETASVSSNQAILTGSASYKKNATIRADDESQTRAGAIGEPVSTSTVSTTYLCQPYPKWKRCMDVFCSLVGLILAAPVILIAAIAIKLTSRGPVFFRQMRSGQFGNAFPIYKLRTMVMDAEELKEELQLLNERDGPAFKIKNDPRVTRLGVILRKTGLDELPQLWNVLVGHMAIVGPRPLPCPEDAKCKGWQRRRLDTKPGLTCIWQISKSRKVSFSDWMRMDLRYADKRTIAGDVGLMFKTVMAVFMGRVGH